MTYKVKLDVFEGPFDLLVYLIENAQMSIYDIQVAEITRQYLAYIEKMKQMDVAVAAEFMVLAAALIEIKSKMLLPRITMDQAGNLVEEDPRSELAQRLLEYKRFRNAAEQLEEQEERAMRIFEKPKEDISQYIGEPDIYLSLDLRQFVAAFNLFLNKKKKLEEIRTNYTRREEHRMSAESKIAFIRGIFKMKNRRTVSFRELLVSGEDKYEVVLTFASLLEMARQKTVKLRQPVPFGEIKISEGGSGDDQ